jgi:hypothetical protein
MSGSAAQNDHRLREGRRVALTLEGFAAEAIDEEADRLGVSVDELVSFSVLYYLADIDSGRIARRITASPYPQSHDGHAQHDGRMQGPQS